MSQSPVRQQRGFTKQTCSCTVTLVHGDWQWMRASSAQLESQAAAQHAGSETQTSEAHRLSAQPGVGWATRQSGAVKS